MAVTSCIRAVSEFSVGNEPDREVTVGGWLLVLCGYLAVWAPVNLAAIAVESLMELPVRGWPLAALLAVRVAIAAVGIGAVLATFDRKPVARPLTQTALLLACAMEIFVYTTSFFPNNRFPGTTPLYVAKTLVFHGGWLLYFVRSSRVRRTIG
jgi:hypothetical protein